MEGGRRAGGASDGDEFEGAWRRASFHADQHGQPGVDVQESRPMEGGRRAGSASDGDGTPDGIFEIRKVRAMTPEPINTNKARQIMLRLKAEVEVGITQR